MEKIIFLDIDGVIATPKTIIKGLWALSEECQGKLGEILSETDAKIVLSSSWRCETLEMTIKLMKEQKFNYCDKLIGITVIANHYIDRSEKIHLSVPRGVEIKQWLDLHIHSDNGKNWKKKKLGKDFNYVILDDQSDMLLEHKDNFVHTKSEIGLTDSDVKRAISILNKTMS